MTEHTDQERRAGGVEPKATCRFGSNTDHPCQRPATVVPAGDDEVRLCYPHALATRLGDVAAAISTAEVLLEEHQRDLARWATEHPDE